LSPSVHKFNADFIS
jgi:hypothetical protein